ncbi:hypothetical protein A2415_02960 [candidate division WWE3 bacterium RIFOXYC1_FULL_39_7]|uniref:Methionyl-tRNA formyltransferase n=2 Tax=Katanobacteria TaxID=422282 RepID=A0A1F4X8J0_UNCKA|nr:MAG: hypothetical protein A2415_02960 [candidate division WWE3 bacterium RIFOXYC1_FULL_39_7]OGC77994.1 MAG: hypothetical protein A2619_02805 [candidate division WWE3 bacterium RIFOXYD1_FULL_39_9]
MKVLLIGWNENAQKCAESIFASKHRLVGFVAPEGFDIKSVKLYCEKKDINFAVLSKQNLIEYVKKLSPDIIVSASWPWILKSDVYLYPKYGTINVHASLLPKNRGQHPLNWAIIRGEKQTGVTIHYIGEGIDDGDIILQQALPIEINDNINSVRDKVIHLGAELVVQALDLIQKGKAPARKQNQAEASFAPKRLPGDGEISWGAPSKDIFNLIRALAKPYPSAFSYKKRGGIVKISKAFVPDRPGVVIGKYKNLFIVTTGDGVILVKSQDLEVGDKLYIPE